MGKSRSQTLRTARAQTAHNRALAAAERERDLAEEARALAQRNEERMYELAEKYTMPDGRRLGVRLELDDRLAVLIRYVCERVPGASAAEAELYWERFVEEKLDIAFEEGERYLAESQTAEARAALLADVPLEGRTAGGLYVPGGGA
jgi:hypothetical protein